LSVEERERWVLTHATEQNIYIDEVPRIRIEVLQLGKSDLHKLEEERPGLIDVVLSGEPLGRMELRALFPAVPGSKAQRTTLMFRRGIWKVTTLYREVERFTGVVVDVETGQTSTNYQAQPGEVIMVLEGFAKTYTSKGKGKSLKYSVESGEEIGFATLRRGLNLTRTEVLPLLLERYPQYSEENINFIEEATRTFTPAAYKSLLQKIIRFRPLQVRLNEIDYPAEFVLEVTIVLLMLHPGARVPDINRYVSGLESAFKRVAVSLFEDSSLDSKDNAVYVQLLAAATLAQKVKSWRPSRSIVVQTLEAARQGLNRSQAYDYNIGRGLQRPPYVVSVTAGFLENASALLDELRSFSSDLGMVRDIAALNGEDLVESDVRPSIMPLIHCVDQHWAPEIGYFYPLEIITEFQDGGSKPFSTLFRKLFSEVTGINPRRPQGRRGRIMNPLTYSQDFEQNLFIKETRRAQELVLLSRQSLARQRPTTSGVQKISYELQDSLLSGLVGALEISGKPTALVTLNPNDPLQLIAVRKPSREMKDPELSDAREA
jgi:hypothetical protein